MLLDTYGLDVFASHRILSMLTTESEVSVSIARNTRIEELPETTRAGTVSLQDTNNELYSFFGGSKILLTTRLNSNEFGLVRPYNLCKVIPAAPFLLPRAASHYFAGPPCTSITASQCRLIDATHAYMYFLRCQLAPFECNCRCIVVTILTEGCFDM